MARLDGFQSDLAMRHCDARAFLDYRGVSPECGSAGLSKSDLRMGKSEAKRNPVHTVLPPPDCSRIPRFLGKNSNHSRRLAKAVERCKMLTILGKTRVFLGFSGLSENPSVAGAIPALSTRTNFMAGYVKTKRERASQCYDNSQRQF